MPIETDIPVAPRYLSPREVAECLPGRHHSHKILRWILEGLLVEGRRVRLSAVRIGARWWVAREDLETFLLETRTPAAANLAGLRLHARRIGERNDRRRHRDARRTLERMGVLPAQGMDGGTRSGRP